MATTASTSAPKSNLTARRRAYAKEGQDVGREEHEGGEQDQGEPVIQPRKDALLESPNGAGEGLVPLDADGARLVGDALRVARLLEQSGKPHVVVGAQADCPVGSRPKISLPFEEVESPHAKRLLRAGVLRPPRRCVTPKTSTKPFRATPREMSSGESVRWSRSSLRA